MTHEVGTFQALTLYRSLKSTLPAGSDNCKIVEDLEALEKRVGLVSVYMYGVQQGTDQVLGGVGNGGIEGDLSSVLNRIERERVTLSSLAEKYQRSNGQLRELGEKFQLLKAVLAEQGAQCLETIEKIDALNISRGLASSGRPQR